MQIGSPSLCLVLEIPKVNKKTQQTPSPHRSTTTSPATLARGGQHLHRCHSRLNSASDKPISLPLHPSQNPPTTTKNPANPISPPVLLISLLPVTAYLSPQRTHLPFTHHQFHPKIITQIELLVKTTLPSILSKTINTILKINEIIAG